MIPEEIDNLTLRLNLYPSDIARLIGCTADDARAYLRGESSPAPDQLAKLVALRDEYAMVKNLNTASFTVLESAVNDDGETVYHGHYLGEPLSLTVAPREDGAGYWSRWELTRPDRADHISAGAPLRLYSRPPGFATVADALTAARDDAVRCLDHWRGHEPPRVRCPKCAGSGQLPDTGNLTTGVTGMRWTSVLRPSGPEPCSWCSGQGSVNPRYAWIAGARAGICPTCEGAGETNPLGLEPVAIDPADLDWEPAPYSRPNCPDCQGTGILSRWWADDRAARERQPAVS